MLSLLQRDAEQTAARPKTGRSPQPIRSGHDHAIRCAACRHRLTSEAQRISVSGSHEHRCVNPDGIIFHIGCFRDAPGCLTLGEPTTEFSWFPGFSWSHAACDGCAEHLGWRFTGTDAPGFFGLVLDRLTVDDEAE